MWRRNTMWVCCCCCCCCCFFVFRAKISERDRYCARYLSETICYPILTFATRSLLVRPSFAELKRWHEVLTDKKYSRYTVFMLTAEENKWNFIHIYVTVFFRTLVFFRTFDLPRSVIGKKFKKSSPKSDFSVLFTN